MFGSVFELASAYGTVGLSLGGTDTHYSLSGSLHPLSKLVIIAVMLRGRHRGLPAAIDRAIMLPYDLGLEEEDEVRNRHSGEQAPSARDAESGTCVENASDNAAV